MPGAHQVDEGQRRGRALVAAAGEVERHLDRRPPGERPVGHAFERQAAQRRRHDGDAEPRRHEVERRDDARRLLADMRAEARLGAGRDDHVVEAAPVGPAVEDEGLVGEVLQGEPRLADQPMACREAPRPCPPAAARWTVMPCGIDQAGADEGDVEPLRRAGRSPCRPSCSPPARRRRRAGCARNSRMARATSGWNGAEVVKPTAMRPTSPRAVRRARISARSACGQDRLGVGQERAAGIGQADAARMAHEQRGVDLALERRICWLSGGCCMCSFSAARVTWPSWATATK